jgi:hypothetical protein
MLAGVVQIQIHLAGIGVREFPQLLDPQSTTMSASMRMPIKTGRTLW